MSKSFFEVLLDVTRQLAGTRSLNPLLEYAVDVSLDLLNAEYGYLVLLQDDETLDFRVRRNRQGQDVLDADNQISRTILNEVVHSGESVITAKAIEDPVFGAARSVGNLQLRSVICVPLIARGRTLGGLYLENRSQDNVFTRENLEALEYFAYQAAIAIENAILNEDLENQVARRTAELDRANQQLREEIRERKRAEQQLLAMAIEQERARILSNFIQDASHQFRTPLTHIMISVNMLMRRLDIESENPYIARIKEQVDLIGQLVDSLVFMAQLDSIDQLDTVPVDLNRFIQELGDVWEVMLQERDQRIELTLADKLPQIAGNKSLLTHALKAVVNNALRYSPEGSTIQIETATEADTVVMRVTDPGEGITEQDLPLVFTRFFRSDTVGTTVGLGLGLSIADKVMELHGGQIKVASQTGEGSTFSLVFPVIT